MPTLEQCIACQCGACDAATTYACAQAGFAGVRSCYDPACAPYCNNPSLSPLADPVNFNNAWWAGAVDLPTQGSTMNGAGCCGKCGGNAGAPAGTPTGTASGPLDPLGNIIKTPCGCSGSPNNRIPWLLIAVVVGFFVLVRK